MEYQSEGKEKQDCAHPFSLILFSTLSTLGCVTSRTRGA